MIFLIILTLCFIVISILLIKFLTKNNFSSINLTKKIMFKDFWPNFNKKNNYFTQLLDKFNYKYEIVNSNPDILIISVFGNLQNNTEKKINNKFPNVRKIFYTGERETILYKRNAPWADLNLTFDYSSNFNNIRFPHWLLYDFNKDLKLKYKNNSKFCCFVYSHTVGFRNNFVKKLSKYKKVDCGGSCLNNVGGKVDDKLKFQRNYKFCIAFENKLQDGYVTEKILEAYTSNCIPIYKGSIGVYKDFNPETFINAHDFESDEDLINYIIKVDNNDELYKSYLNKPIFSKVWLDRFNDPYDTFYKNIAKKIYN